VSDGAQVGRVVAAVQWFTAHRPTGYQGISAAERERQQARAAGEFSPGGDEMARV
jgi:hypothetical protein